MIGTSGSLNDSKKKESFLRFVGILCTQVLRNTISKDQCAMTIGKNSGLSMEHVLAT